MKLHPVFACTLALVSLTAIGLSAAQETSDSFSYHMPGRGWLQLAGVCNADPELVTCWKPTGEPNPKLSELMNAYFLVNSQQRLEIRYKHRSLMLVAKSMLNNSPGQGSLSFNGLQVDPGGNLNQQGNIGYGGQDEETTTFYWFYPAEALNSVDVTAQLNIATQGVQVPLKVDADARLTGGHVRITKIEKASDSDIPQFGYPNAPKGPHWTVSYGLTGDGPEPVTSVYASALDNDGNQISQVDSKGNPVKQRPRGRMYDGPQPAYPVTNISGNRILLGVNPDKVAFLLITGNAQKKVMFKSVVLQPSK